MKKKPLFYSIFLISSISIVSKLIGFFREGLIAFHFGTTIHTDIYYLSYGVVVAFIAVIGSSIGIAYLPLFIANKENLGIEKSLQKASNLLIQLFIICLLLSFFLFLFSSQASQLIAPTYDIINLQILSRHIRIFSFGLFFLITSYLLSAILNAQRRFGIAEFLGMSYSVITILAIICFSGSIGIEAIVYAVPISAILQFIILLFLVFRKTKLTNKIEYNFLSPENRKLYLLILPILLGTGTLYLGLSIDKIIASTLSAGSVSALSYAGILHSMINVFFITSVVNVFFTEFSQKSASQDTSGLINIWKRGITLLFMILLPISIFIVIYSTDVVAILLKRGQFTQKSVELTAYALVFYVLGSPFYGIRDMTTRVFYAQKNTKTPMINGAISLAANVILSFLLSRIFGVGGITLASAITAFFSCVFLLFSLNKKLTYDIKTVFPTFFKIIGSSFIFIFILLLLKRNLHFSYLFLNILIPIIFSFGIYFIFLYIFKCKEIIPYFQKISQLFQKKNA